MHNKDFKILVVDDEQNFRNFLNDALVPEGYPVDKAEDGVEGLKKIKSISYDLAFIDIKIPRKDGLTLLKEAKQIQPNMQVITMSALKNLDSVIESIKLGAYYFLNKPIDLDLLYKFVKQLKEYKFTNQEKLNLKNNKAKSDGPVIIGNSANLLSEIEKAIKIAKTDASCIIFGESGTGKELACELIHKESNRKTKPLYKINCAAIPTNLLESELFGYEKGAFTGAYKTTKGMFELSDEGTLFLDEIGDMELSLQAKILRVLENGEFYRLGGQEVLKTDVRIISATHQNLLKKIEEGTFREDLYYRLNVVSLTLPALRDRKEDIPLLVEFLIDEISKKNKIADKEISEEALKYLTNYPFHGNIRELSNLLERALVLSKGNIIELGDISFISKADNRKAENDVINLSIEVGTAMSSIESMVIENTLRLFDGDKNKTAQSLGISTRKVFYKIKEDAQNKY